MPIVHDELRRLAHHYVRRERAGHRSDDFGALDDALNALAARAPRKARVVELRFFGGVSVEETAEVLRVSPITVMPELKSAKAWLDRELAGPGANGQ
jgi:DNA-directed RNA polymerase specialized sigma24 family protein